MVATQFTAKTSRPLSVFSTSFRGKVNDVRDGVKNEYDSTKNGISPVFDLACLNNLVLRPKKKWNQIKPSQHCTKAIHKNVKLCYCRLII